jgi:signal transduction histidine kinase
VNLLYDGPQSRFLNKIGLLAELRRQKAALDDVEPLLSFEYLTTAQLEHLQQALNDFSALMLKASGRAMTAQWEELGAGIDRNRNAILTVLFIMIAILFCSVFVAVQLLAALKRSRQSERIKQQQLELQKELEHERKVSELYRSFGAMLSHQFRTPLAIIDASMQRLIRAGERMTSEQVISRAVKVKAATDRLTHLIESILNADQLLDQVDIQLQNFPLVDLVKQAIDEQVFIGTQRQVKFTYEGAKALQVMCDPVLVGQIIENMLSNADKYSPADKVVSVRIYQSEHYVCCEVQDLGRVIPEEELPYIFRRYFRSQSVTDVVGTGIGLYVAAELAELQNGRLTVTSKVNIGSIFTLYLPLAFVE